jgi:hypothetical protein
MSVQVVPTPLTTVVPIVYGFSYTVNTFKLNSFISFNVILNDQNGTPLSVKQVTISGEDYANWGNNDAYVIDYICNSLGLIPLPEPPVEPTPEPTPEAPVEPTPEAPVEPTPEAPVEGV